MRPLYVKLKPGPGHSADEVRTSQRARIHRAMYELVAERGYAGLTVRGLSRTSEVSTRTFYTQFANVEDCFASTYRSIMKGAADRLSETITRSRDRSEGLRSSIRVLANLVADNPQAARLALIDCYDGGPAMLREVEIATASIERQLAAGPAPLPLPLSQGVVAGVERVLRSKLLEDRQDELPGIAGALATWVLSVCDRPAPPPAPTSTPPALPPRRTSGRSDPGFTAFEAIDGDRGRVLAAVAKLSAKEGYWALTPPKLRREAGVSRRHFDLLFESVEHCYLEAIEVMALAGARRAVEKVTATTWEHRVPQLARHACTEIAASAHLSRLAFSELYASGSTGLRCREHLLSRAASWMRTSAPSRHGMSELTAEASVAASWRLMQVELTAKGPASRLRDAPPFIAHVVLASA